MRTTGRSTSPFFTVAFAAVTICIAVQSAAFCQMDASSSARTGSARAWRADLSVLAHEMPRLHPNLFVAVSSAEFETAVTELDRRLPELTENEITGELFRIACSSEPWRPGWSQRGWCLSAPDSNPSFLSSSTSSAMASSSSRPPPTNRHLIGSRVVRIGRRTADEAAGILDPLISRDNRMTVRSKLPSFPHRAATPQGGRDRPAPAMRSSFCWKIAIASTFPIGLQESLRIVPMPPTREPARNEP